MLAEGDNQTMGTGKNLQTEWRGEIFRLKDVYAMWSNIRRRTSEEMPGHGQDM